MNNRVKDKDNQWVCMDCGNEYIREQGLPERTGISTAHKGTCCCCGETKTVLHERNYSWLRYWKTDKTTG